MKDPYLDSLLELLANEPLDTEGPHLISVDELRAAGALDVPAAWRKSLGVERERSLFDDLLDDDASTDQPSASQHDPEDDEAADEVA